MAENRYAEAHNAANLLLRFAEDVEDADWFHQDRYVRDAETRIRELLTAEIREQERCWRHTDG